MPAGIFGVVTAFGAGAAAGAADVCPPVALYRSLM